MTTPNPYPFQTVASPPAKPATRRVMGVEVCVVCDLAVAYCKCAAAPPPPPTQGDGAESSLNVRIRELI